MDTFIAACVAVNEGEGDCGQSAVAEISDKSLSSMMWTPLQTTLAEYACHLCRSHECHHRLLIVINVTAEMTAHCTKRERVWMKIDNGNEQV